MTPEEKLVSRALGRAGRTRAVPGDLRLCSQVLNAGDSVISEVTGPKHVLEDALDSMIAAAGEQGAEPVTLVHTQPPKDMAREEAERLAQAAAETGIRRACFAGPQTAELPAFPAALRRHGVSVTTDLCRAEALVLNEAPLVRAATGRPFVHLFAVQSIDGRLIRRGDPAIPQDVAVFRSTLSREYDLFLEAGVPEFTERIAAGRWDRLTLVYLDELRPRGEDSIGDLGVREMSDTRSLEGAAWYSLGPALLLSGYRSLAETFGSLWGEQDPTGALPLYAFGVTEVEIETGSSSLLRQLNAGGLS